MTALPAGQVENTVLFATGRDRQPFGCAAVGGLDPRHVQIAWQGLRRQIQPAAQPGQDTAEGMLDAGLVVIAPGVRRQRSAIGGQFRQRGVRRVPQQRRPVGIAGIEQV